MRSCSEYCGDARTFLTVTVPTTCREFVSNAKEQGPKVLNSGKTLFTETLPEVGTNFKEWAMKNKALAAGGGVCMVAVAALSYYLGMRLIPALVLTLITTPVWYATIVVKAGDSNGTRVALACLAGQVALGSLGRVPFLLAAATVAAIFFTA